MIVDFNLILSFVTATAILAISPGPDNIFVMLQSVAYGQRQGIVIVLGLMTGCLVHTILVALGLSTFLKTAPNFMFFLKMLGALYMLYLAVIVFRSKPASKNFGAVADKTFWNWYKQGFIMNVINPKVSIFFLAFFPSFLFSDSIDLKIQFFILGTLFIITSFIVFSAVVFLSKFLTNLFYSNTQYRTYFNKLQVLVFVSLALFMLCS